MALPPPLTMRSRRKISAIIMDIFEIIHKILEKLILPLCPPFIAYIYLDTIIKSASSVGWNFFSKVRLLSTLVEQLSYYLGNLNVHAV